MSYRIRPNAYALTMLAGMLFFSSTATTADIETGIGIGAEYTDNARLASTNEVHDVIVVTSVGAVIDVNTGPFQFDADTSLRHRHHTRDTFSDQQYFNLNMTADWGMIKNRFNWILQDFFTQQSINSLDPSTPDNTQDTNVLTFGANIFFPISRRQSVTLQPEYRKYTYEIQNLDNQQNALNVNWNYQIFRTMIIGLGGGRNETDYNEQAISDNTFSNIHLVVSGERPRSDYSINLGTTHVEREGGDGQRGLTGNLTMQQNLTANASMRTYLSSDLTDTNNGLLNASLNPDNGDFTNVQISSEVFRDSVIRLAYVRQYGTLGSTVWGELRKQDYESALIDREVQALGMVFNYPVTATLSSGISTSYSRTELTDIDRRDKRYSVGGNIRYRMSRKLSLTIDLNYEGKNSDVETEDFNETSIFVNFIYGHGLSSR